MFSTLDHKTGIAKFQSKGGDRFIHAIKCALGTSPIVAMSLNSLEANLTAFADTHNSASPSSLMYRN
jgi:hypothetical protein